MVKSGLEFILKLTEPLQSCCCPVQKYLPRLAELAWQLSRYLWRGSVNFKINSRPLFTIIFKLKNDNFKTRDFSPLIERVLVGVRQKKWIQGALTKLSQSTHLLFVSYAHCRRHAIRWPKFIVSAYLISWPHDLPQFIVAVDSIGGDSYNVLFKDTHGLNSVG